MTDTVPNPEQSRDLRAVTYFLIAVALAALVLGWVWYSQRAPSSQAPMAANQPVGVGLVQGNTGGGSGF
jgi:hypothetical protein